MTEQIKFLDLHKQYISIEKEINESIYSVIRDSEFIGGKYVRQFEENFSAYQEANHCIGVGNGTDALEIAIESMDLPKGSEIIVPANSFIATAEAVSRTGHRVVFCDVNEDDYTINIDDLEKRLTCNTSAVIAVHLYGHPCNMEAIVGVGKRHNLTIIEDCAQAHGAEYKGHRVGCIGDVGCFSFYPGKNLGAYGDAGAIVTNDDFVAKKCRMIANHGRISKHNHEFEGRNSRLDGLQASILNIKLKHLDVWTQHRIDLATLYIELLKKVPGIILPHHHSWAKHVYHLFVIRHVNRDEIIQCLAEAGIQTGVHYPVALPKLPAFEYIHQGNERRFGWQCGETILSLPIGDALSSSNARKICDRLIGFFN